MANLFNSNPSEKVNFSKLFVVYVLYFDESRGHLPLIIYPIETEKYKESKRFMRPIKYHSIWFMPIEEAEVLDHIDLEYKGYTFFGKKFLTKSKRKKRRAGLDEDTPETIVIIVSLPNDMEIFGDGLIQVMTKEIRGKFENKLFKIIEGEIAKEAIIKSAQVKKNVEIGNKIKNELANLIATTSEEFFTKAVKQTDSTSIKQQKALSYLSLKGIDVSHLNSTQGEDDFAKIKIFDIGQKTEDTLNIKKPKWIFDVNIADDSQEMEIKVQNNSDKELNNLAVKITHVKDFFEQEIMNQMIDLWFPEEELLFISPIIPYIKEYLFFIFDGNEKLISKKLNLNILKK